MPVQRIYPKIEERPDIIQELTRVLREDRPEGPETEPRFVIEELRFSDNLHVTVIWDGFAGIDPQERGRLILAAIGEEWGEAKMLNVSLAMGLTQQEALRLNISGA